MSENHVNIGPETMSFSVAASVFVDFGIACYALYDAGRSLAGKSISTHLSQVMDLGRHIFS